MNLRLFQTLYGLCFTLLCVSAAQAKTVTLDIDVDLDNYVSLNEIAYVQEIAVNVPTLYTGDQIDLTLNFINGKRLLLSDVIDPAIQRIGLLFFPDNEANDIIVRNNVSVSLLGVIGEARTPISGQCNCNTCVCGSITRSITESSFSFSGLRALITITDIAIPFGSERLRFSVINEWGTIHIIATTIPISIDIRPGSDTNPLNLRSQGVIPVAILTTEEFDATTVDPASVLFADAPPLRWAMEDVDGDTDWDVVYHFLTQETGIACGDTEATLTGKTFDGVDIAGTDSITTVACSP